MSNGRLSGSGLGRMHDVLAGYVERDEVPGLVALVSRRGDVHIDAVGSKTLGGDPVAHDTIFRIASMSKPVAAVAAMILVEECVLRLDEPVDRLLPELADRMVLARLDAQLADTVRAYRPITLRDLLTFTMGFGQLMASPEAYPILQAATEQQIGMGPPSPATMPAPDEWMRRLGALPLMAQPGERWLYNTGSDVLGVLIARAAGQPLEAFLRDRIFAPLGMVDTGFSVPAAKLDRLATAYWTDAATRALAVFDEAEGGQWSSPPAFPSAAGGLVSTVDDYLSFGQMLLDGGQRGGERIVARPSVELMTTDQLTPRQKGPGLVLDYWEGHGWGFGLSVVTRRSDVALGVGSFGWDGGLGTSWWTDPAEELVGILLTQAAWTSPNAPGVTRDFWTSAYAAIDD